jgi:hypothetical protein
MASILKIVSHGGPTTLSLSDYVGKHGEFLLDPDTGQILFLDGETPGGTPIGGTLPGFASAIDAAPPNDTVNVSILVAVGGTADQDITLVPAGAGGFSLSVPDGSSTGGNKRGNYAVDLQIFAAGKNSPTEVASGPYSFACGSGNTSSGPQSFSEGVFNVSAGVASHAEGFGNVASDFACHAEGSGTSATTGYSHAEGSGTTASNYYAHAEGYQTTASGAASHAEGHQTTASGESTHAGGLNSSAINAFAFAHGVNILSDGTGSFVTGQDAVGHGINYYQSYSSGRISFQGDNQTGRLGIKTTTTDTETFVMTSDMAAPGVANQLIIPNNGAVYCTGTVVAFATTSPNGAAGFSFSICVKNLDGTVSVVGVPVKTKDFSDLGDPTDTWNIDFAIDNTNKGISISVLGSTGASILWFGEIRSQEIQFPTP